MSCAILGFFVKCSAVGWRITGIVQFGLTYAGCDMPVPATRSIERFVFALKSREGAPGHFGPSTAHKEPSRLYQKSVGLNGKYGRFGTSK